MMQAQLCQNCINGLNLHPGTATAISQVRSCNVIVSRGNEQGDSRKTVQDLFAIARTRKALQKLLQDEASGKNRLAGLDRLNQRPHLFCRRGRAAPQRKGPNASINEDAQSRVRSAL